MTAVLILAAVGSPAACAVWWNWRAGRPQGWDTMATASGTRLESPMFTVTGDSIGVRFNGTVPNDISVALLTLDGAVQFESVAAAGSNVPEIAWDVSSMRGRTLFLVIDGADNHIAGLAEVTIDGVVNDLADRQREAYRTIHARLARFDPAAVEAAREAISRLSGNTTTTLPPYDASAAARLYTELRELVRSGEADDIAAVAPPLDSLLALTERILLSHPRLADTPIMFVSGSRPPTTETAASGPGGGALKLLTLTGGRPEVITLIEPDTGAVYDPHVNFDGDRAVVSILHKDLNGSSLFEFTISDRTLTPLTSAEDVSDSDAAYLPDGTIVFASTRDRRFGPDGRALSSLYRMGGDGTNIHRIGGVQSEIPLSVMPDGRILYTRTNHDTGASSLFTVNIDGAAHTLFWNGGEKFPGAVTGAHMLPTSGETICLIEPAGSDGPGILALIDRRMGMNASIVIRTWPAGSIDTSTGETRLTRASHDAAHADPIPLDDNFYLCTRTAFGDSVPGIWLIDRFGNELPLYTDPAGCHEPVPVMTRTRPPVIPPRRNYTDENGKLYVLNVYDGTGLDGVEAGTAASLRIIETLPRHTSTAVKTPGVTIITPAIGPGTSDVRHILGTVPVESDGSAFFSLPSGRAVSFQLLDGDGQLIQSMHSGVMVQAGETTGCMGCHDNRTAAPPTAVTKVPLALTREPSQLDNTATSAVPGFMDTIQPILTASCVRCHDYGASAEETLNLAPDRATVYNTAYIELWRGGLTGWSADAAVNGTMQTPFSRGSAVSGLVRILRDGHLDVNLSDDDFRRIAAWIDLGAPYYGDYSAAYPGNPAGRSPLDTEQLARLAVLTGETVTRLADIDGDIPPLISFDRPEESRCLVIFDGNHESDEYHDAVAIIDEGKHALESIPRAGMTGFTPSIRDSLDLARAARAAETESLNREAIRGGFRLTDTFSKSDE